MFIEMQQNLIKRLQSNSISRTKIAFYGITSVILFFLFTPYLFMGLIKTILLPFGLPAVFGVQFIHWLSHSMPLGISIILLAYILVHTIGIWLCWKANKKRDNQQFMARFACLSVPARIYTYLKGAAWSCIIYFIGLLIYHIMQYYELLPHIFSPSIIAWSNAHASILMLFLQHGTFLLITMWYYSLLRKNITATAQDSK